MDIDKTQLYQKLSNLLVYGDFLGFKDFVESKEMNFLLDYPKKNYVMFETACVSGNIELLDYLLHSTQIHPEFQKELNFIGGFDLCCMSGDFELVQHFISSGKINMQESEYNGLIFAFSKGHKNIIEYLLFSDNIEHAVDIHAQNDIIFKTMLDRKSFQMIHYFINELNINKNSTIDFYLQDNTETNIKIRTMFLERDLKEKNNVKINKMKI